MKKLLTLTLWIFFLGGNIGFATEYSFIKSLTEAVHKIVPAQNGYFYTLSRQLDCPDDHVVVRYFDKQGDIQSTFRSPGFIGNMIGLEGVVNANNNLVLYIKMDDINHIMFELTSAGSIVWNNNLQFTNPIITFKKISLAPNGYYLLGNTKNLSTLDSAKAILTKINTIGKHVWTKYYTMNNSLASSVNLNDMIYENNQLVCSGSYFYTSLATGWPPLRPLICILDTVGNIQQSYAYTVDSNMFGFDEYKFMQIEKSSLGNYYLLAFNSATEHALFKLNSAFQIQWIKEKLSGKAYTICAGFNDDIFIVPENPKSNYILQFDANGNVLSNHLTKSGVSGYNHYGAIQCIKKAECGFLLSNDETMIAHTNKQMIYCTDSSTTLSAGYYSVNTHTRSNQALMNGTLTNLNEYLSTATFVTSVTTAVNDCDTIYSCNGSTNIENANLSELTFYPNPVSDFLKIKSASKPANIQLCDMQGNIIHSIKPMDNECSISVAGLNSGVYLLKIIHRNEVIIHKIIVRH